MLRITIISLTLILIAATESANACNAISRDVAQLGSALNSLSQNDRMGDVVVCAAEAAASNDSSSKKVYLDKVNQIEAYLEGAGLPPMIHSELEQIKAELIK